MRTAATITAKGVTVAEDGIEPQVGEIWKIFTGSRRQPFDTSICAGSGRVTVGWPSGARPLEGLSGGRPAETDRCAR